MNKYIYNFEEETGLDQEGAKILLGSKGSNLGIMTRKGFPVPFGFTITSKACQAHFKENLDIYSIIKSDLHKNIALVEAKHQKKFGDPHNPLLISVRSGSAVSMPGMMDTILNLGMNDEIAEGLAKRTNPAFAYDCYIRFIEIFASVVLGVDSSVLDKHKEEFLRGLNHDVNHNLNHSLNHGVNLAEKIQNIDQAKELVDLYKRVIKSYSEEFPDDPYKQLDLAIQAVINSWDSSRAKIYRKLNNVSDDLGTAVTIQAMVFGNFDNNSGTGVLFTRNPVNGVDEIYGEFLENAQGEEIVSGKRTPKPICSAPSSMEELMPKQFAELNSTCKKLEEYYRDVQDIEFTIESGKLYILQTRSAKRTIASSVKIAYDMAMSGLISKSEALMRLDISKINFLLHPSLPKKIADKPIGTGLPASPGAATGRIVFSSEAAELHAAKYDVILLRQDTCPKDIHGMSISQGIVTSRGGLTSHAAVVARGLGRPCISGIADLHIDFENKTARIHHHELNELDEITIDGATGRIFLGKLPVEEAKISPEFSSMLEWADEYKALSIRANAETESDLETAINFSAEGIGLCRTEHMFFEAKKISLVRQAIISQSLEERKLILDQLLPLHKADFVSMLRLLEGKPINIRLIDPPLHEFLPKDDEDIKLLASKMNMEPHLLYQILDKMSEVNPMLGHRGGRLGITHPDFYEMQVKAIITAAVKVKREGIPVNIEIMLPLISNEKELIVLKDLVNKAAQNVMIALGDSVEYKLGTMIELPRAAVIADKIAHHVDYFSYGTNDLTQTVYGISRDDSAIFMPDYKNHGIFEKDPFETIDREGVGHFITDSKAKGLSSNKYLKFGVCGEHGGDPESILFFSEIGMDYVSCSPFRIPVAKIAAAQASIKISSEQNS